MEPSLREKFWSWIDPAHLMSFAIYHYAIAVWHSLLRHPSDLLNGKTHANAFASLLLSMAPPADKNKTSHGRNQGAAAAVPGLLQEASGVVLELGPGSGTLMPHFDFTKVTALYEVEPAVELHAALRQSADFVGLVEGESFHILGCGGEVDSLLPMLHEKGVLGDHAAPMFDTIVAIRSLCSVDKPQEAVQCHYALLKPGGKFIVFEHVVNAWPAANGSFIGMVLQLVYTVLGWPFFLGCRLTSDTIGSLLDAAKADGGWGEVSVTREQEWSALPWAYGMFVKKEL